MAFDGKAFGIEIVDAVKDHIDRRLSPIQSAIDGFNSRLSDLERKFAELPIPTDGVAGAPGKDADLADVGRLIDEKIAALGETISSRPVIERADIDDAVTRVIDDRLPAAVAKIEITQPQNGKDGADGKDGIGLAGGFINREGHLVLAVSNGDIKVLDRVVGRDGRDGEKGERGEPGTVDTDHVNRVLADLAKASGAELSSQLEERHTAAIAEIKALTTEFAAAHIDAELFSRFQNLSASLKSEAKASFDQLASQVADLGSTIADQVKTAASHEVAALSSGLEASAKAHIEEQVANIPHGRDGRDGEPGEPGKDAAPIPLVLIEEKIRDQVKSQTLPLIRAEVLGAVAALPLAEKGERGDAGAPGEKGEPGTPGQAGQDADPEVVRDLVLTELKAVALQEVAAQLDERSGSMVHGIETVAKTFIEEQIAKLPPAKDGRDGADVDHAAVEASIVRYVAKAVAALPAAKDGEPGRDGKDGVGVAGAVIDRDGELTLTLSDGTTRGLGIIVGRNGVDGVDGKSADPAEIERIVVARVAAAMAEVPVPQNGRDGRDGIDGAAGKDVDPAYVETLVIAHVDSAVAALPAPKDGKDGEDGKDADPDIIARMVETEVTKAVEALPRPADGHTPTPEELAPLIANEVYRAVAALPAAKDGVGMAGTLLDRDGNLVVTLTDGKSCLLGPVIGRDGKDGIDGHDGKDIDMDRVLDVAKAEIAKLPVPRDGKDGADGISFTDVNIEYDGERNWSVVFAKGDQVKRFGPFRLPTTIDRGVYREDSTYETGDCVSFGGSTWVALRDSPEIPGRGDNNGWRLSAKAGRPGKDGKNFDEDRIQAAEKSILEIKRVLKEKL